MPPTPPRHKSVTFCTRCDPPAGSRSLARDPHDPHVRYYSDPGLKTNTKGKQTDASTKRSDSTDSESSKKYQGYYSEPDAKYFEIDYQFLKQLRHIAKINCPKCERRNRSRKRDDTKRDKPLKMKTRTSKSTRSENYILCNGRYHTDREHCQVCCKVCNRSTDTLDSLDDDLYSPVCRSYSLPASRVAASRAKSAPRPTSAAHVERKASIQSTKSVSFLEMAKDKAAKEQPNYTTKSFTNDLKQFLLRPAAPRLSLRDKLIVSLKQEFESKKTSPKLRAIKGLWKSY